nr:class I SAM-dependent methyltransferase [uncultured Rhodoferax sp.]
MNKLQQLVFNDGERLVPYVSHDENELVRHRSSYAFFHSIIAADLSNPPLRSTQVTVADLGFGSGYGCALLSSLPDTHITGIDIGNECQTFARQYYPRSNVQYLIEDLAKFIPTAQPFDYVVSRGVLEHVPNGLNLIKDIKFDRRVMVDVPYDEAPGNEHHVLTGIKEDAFTSLANSEIFYEDLDGRIFDAANKPRKPNMIMIVLSAPELPKICSILKFPLQPVRDNKLELLSGINAMGSHHYYDSAVELLTAIEKTVKETEVVVDIGCGIVPMNYFRPKLHFMVEPWQEYSDILTYRHTGDKSVIVLRTGAVEALRQFGDNSVDSVFLLDVIEHLEKEEGQKIVVESERVAREQIVIFTPLGYMPQHIGKDQTDGWGLSGSSVQEHRSGWFPEDFDSAWSFHICKNFHSLDFKGKPLDATYGAFYAVRNFDNKLSAKPEQFSDIRRPLPSEQRLAILNSEYEALDRRYQTLLRFPPVQLARMLMRTLRFLKKKFTTTDPNQ